MFENFNNSKSPENSLEESKKALWDKMLDDLNEITDATGRGIDEGIKESVVALNANEIPTIQSCEGHSEVEGGHRPWPWVSISAPNEPEDRFVDEQITFEKIALENGVALEDLKRGYPWELYTDARRIISNNPETEEYKKWQEENIQLHQKVELLLDEFYKSRDAHDDVKLKLTDNTGNEFELSSVNDRDLIVRFLDGDLSEEEKRELLENLPARQSEMQQFTSFLKDKFLR